MRGLAEYAMHGRHRAIIIVLLCGFFPMLYFFSAAMVALVTLRKSASDGALILLWSLLPAGVLWYMGDTTPLILMLSVAVLAQVLKRTESWPLVFMLGTVIGLGVQLSLIWQTAYVTQVETLVNDVIAAQQSQGAQVEFSAQELVDLLLGFYGAYHFFATIVCLMLGRWWQAVLYNPGGFRKEFHALRFDPRFMAVLTALIIGGLMSAGPLDDWLTIFCIPPMFGGLALMHWAVAFYKAGTFALAIGYLALFMVSPLVILLGLLDSVANFRKRLTA